MEIFRFLFLCSFYCAGIATYVGPFSRHHVAVWFHPQVSEDDIIVTYNTNELFPIISKISIRFNKIMVGTTSRVNSLESSLPVAVARYNKRHILHQQPLEVLLTFGASLSKKSTSNDFIHARRVADEANQIYPGTVKWFYFYIDTLESRNIMEIKSNLMYIQRQINHTGYILGLIIPGKNCDQSVDLSVLSPFIREIIFSYWPAPEAYVPQDPNVEVPRIAKEFRKCSRKITAQNKDISVGLLTGWISEKKTENIQNDLNLLTFWEKIHDWAVHRDVFVVLCEEVDNLYQNDYCKQAEWWRLRKTDSSLMNFEEKQIAVNDNAKRAANKKDDDMDEKSVEVEFSLFPAVVGIAILLFVCFEATEILWKIAPDITTSPQNKYKRRRLKQYREMALQDVGEGYYGNFLDRRKKTYKKDPKLSEALKTGICLHE